MDIWAERTARDDVKRWTLCVRDSIDQFTRLATAQLRADQTSLLGPPTEEQQVANIREAHAVDRIWGDANHWYTAIAGHGLPRELRRAIAKGLNLDIKVTVQHMRNITEHWETNRRRLQEEKFEGRDARSLRWYRDRDLINGPWSWGWGKGTGFELAQVLRLDLLVEEVSNVELIVSQRSVSDI